MQVFVVLLYTFKKDKFETFQSEKLEEGPSHSVSSPPF